MSYWESVGQGNQNSNSKPPLDLKTAMIIAIAILVTGAAVAYLISGRSGNEEKSSETASARKAGDASAESVTGTEDDWLSAVCRPGSPISNNAPPVMQTMGATGGAQCMSRQVGGALVLFSQWDSNFKMRNAMEYMRQCYASVILDGVFIETFSVVATVGSNPLAPLGQFGFTATC